MGVIGNDVDNGSCSRDRSAGASESGVVNSARELNPRPSLRCYLRSSTPTCDKSGKAIAIAASQRTMEMAEAGCLAPPRSHRGMGGSMMISRRQIIAAGSVAPVMLTGAAIGLDESPRRTLVRDSEGSDGLQRASCRGRATRSALCGLVRW
jgi:hypothetical protein